MEEETITALENRSWRHITQIRGTSIKVDLAKPATTRDGIFAVILDKEPCVAVNEAALVFLTHPKPEHQVIYPHEYRSYQDLGRDINTRLGEGTRPDDVPRLIVIHRRQVFRVWSITGTIYVIWARTVTRSVEGSDEPPLELEHVPVLFEMTGQMAVRSVCLLDSRFTPGPIDLRAARVFFPASLPSIFPVEADTRFTTEPRPVSYSEGRVTALVRGHQRFRLAETLAHQARPFETESTTSSRDVSEDEVDEIEASSIHAMAQRFSLKPM